MNELTIFASEIGISLAISAATIATVQKPLTLVLTDLCGTAARAEFWKTYTNLMLVIAPLLIAVLFASPNAAEGLSLSLMRRLLGCCLAGIALALIAVGLNVNAPALKHRNQE